MTISLLTEMLTYKRPAFSKTEEAFIEKFLYPLGVKRDTFGNIYKQVGESDTLWSCHTDTVHREDGRQRVTINGNTVGVGSKNSNCLGADCTTGVWLMHQMILAKKPGLYIFHRAEERGGRGSDHIASKTPELLDGIKKAIAFDRFGTTSVITFQGYRCCSDSFAHSLKAQLPGFELDDGGIFTDTANYTELVPECTNLSVGYDHHHTDREVQNLTFAEFLLDHILKLDTDALAVDRDTDHLDYPTPTQSLGRDSMVPIIKNNPGAVADLLTLYGITFDELCEHVFATSGTLLGEFW